MNLRSKRILMPAIVSLIAAMGFSQEPAHTEIDLRQLIGSWEGSNEKGETAEIQFQPGGHVQMTFNGERLVPEVPGGPSLKFKIDQTKTPIWIDFIAYDASGKELGRIKFLLKMTGPKSMKIQAG